MKQRITIEQLKELTWLQSDKLRELWVPKAYDVFCNSGLVSVVDSLEDEFIFTIEDDRGCYKENCLPLLSMGQCIELLHELVKERDNNRTILWVSPNNLWNTETLDKKDSKWGEEHIWIKDKKEPIDALWEAVKSIL